MMSVSLRLATVDDVESLFEIRTSVAQNHLSREQMDELGITPQVLRSAINEGPCIWLAEVDRQPVAFSMIDRAEGEVFAMFVRPEHEKCGLGRLLMDAAEAHAAREWNVPVMQMTVIDVRDELIAFYERRGYRRTGIKKPFPYGDPRFGLPRRDDLRFEVLEKAL